MCVCRCSVVGSFRSDFLYVKILCFTYKILVGNKGLKAHLHVPIPRPLPPPPRRRPKLQGLAGCHCPRLDS